MSIAATRVGIIGLGRSGWDLHAAALTDHRGYQVTAVADPMTERRTEAQARFDCVAYPDPAGLLADPNVELVVVATPSHTHVELGIAALAAGKHVVIEKPMADSVAGVDALIAAAEQADRFVSCFQPRRLDPDFVAVQDVITSGRLGELVLIRRSADRFSRRADWQMLRKFGGGELLNTAPHLLDQVLQLVGDGPLEVFSDLRHTVGAGDAEDHVKLVLRGKTGPLVEVESSCCVAMPQDSWLIAGTAGGLSGSETRLTVRWLDPAVLVPLEVDEGPAAGRRYGTGETIEWFEETIELSADVSSSWRYYDRLHATLHDGAPLLITPQDTRRQLEVIEQGRQM